MFEHLFLKTPICCAGDVHFPITLSDMQVPEDVILHVIQLHHGVEFVEKHIT